MTLPEIPASVFTPIGQVPVELVPDLKDQDGDECLGTWNYGERKLRLRPGQSPAALWQTLFHEKVHMWLSDSGVSTFLTDKQEEAICDCLSSALLAEMLNDLQSPEVSLPPTTS